MRACCIAIVRNRERQMVVDFVKCTEMAVNTKGET